MAPGWLIFRDGCPGGEAPEQVGARVDRVIARSRAVDGDIALFAHGHVLRVFAARWIGLPPSGGQHFLLNTGTLCVLGYYREIPAVRIWNGPLLDRRVMIGRSESWSTNERDSMAAIRFCGCNLGELLSAHERFNRGAAE